MKGAFNGIKGYRGTRLGTVDIDWVYNSMPPNTGQIFPEVELKKVVDF
ncbi:MAG: hypothetical protein KAU17_04905 [Spirochaetales bacterium]|nr:hypothetical protein [Spirochaetales bacterium]